jgi:hypothetical protein
MFCLLAPGIVAALRELPITAGIQTSNTFILTLTFLHKKGNLASATNLRKNNNESAKGIFPY